MKKITASAANLFTILFLAAIIIFGFAGCKSKEPSKDDYINASVEFICYTSENPSIITDENLSANKLKEIFGKYNFPVDDNEKMKEILAKFGADQPTTDEIASQIEKCSNKK